MKNGFVYTQEHTREISFPIGGIGSGCIGLAGNGRLVDWEIFNRSGKGSTNGYSHFSVKAERNGQVLDARVLHGDPPAPYTGSFSGRLYNGYGTAPPRNYLPGTPHFEHVVFRGGYPFAELTFRDPEFPGIVRTTAFNPFIPLDADNSSLPAAFFELEVENSTQEALDYTLCLCLRNSGVKGTTTNTHDPSAGLTLVRMTGDEHPPEGPGFGEMSVATDAEDASFQEYLFRGSWFDNLSRCWSELNCPDHFANRSYPGKNPASGRFATEDHCLVAAHVAVNPGSSKRARFLISWYYPNCVNYWDPECCSGADCGVLATWKNYYATRFADSSAVARYCFEKWDWLYRKTGDFKEALFSSSMPAEAAEAVSANLSILKSPTVLRLGDGTLYGWEGCHAEEGCCGGSCSHVWNYEYAVPFLFPRLERSMRDVDFRYNTAEDGSVSFRLQLPLGRPRLDFRPCADGQMGGVIQAYREWKISGDDAWLASHWDTIKRCVEFAWSEHNRDKWDLDRDGVLEGRQHHTLDMELFGPNAWLTGYYLAALKAAGEMAEHFGETGKPGKRANTRACSSKAAGGPTKTSLTASITASAST